MKNYIQAGDVISVAAPSGGVTSGDGVEIGNLFGVAITTAAATEKFGLQRTGVVELTKLTTDDVGVGDVLYWDSGNDRLTKTAGSHNAVGTAVEAAGTTATTCKIVLVPQLA